MIFDDSLYIKFNNLFSAISNFLYGIERIQMADVFFQRIDLNYDVIVMKTIKNDIKQLYGAVHLYWFQGKVQENPIKTAHEIDHNSTSTEVCRTVIYKRYNIAYIEPIVRSWWRSRMKRIRIVDDNLICFFKIMLKNYWRHSFRYIRTRGRSRIWS